MKKSIVAIVLIAVILFVFYGIRSANTPVEKQRATMVTVEQSIKGECYIAKNERVYTAENTGTFYSYKPEGERVAGSTRIAAVYNGSVDSDILTEISNISKKISELTKKSESSSLFFSDSQNSESAMDTIKNKIISDVQSGDVSNMSDYKNEIVQNITGVENTEDAQIAELEAKLEQLQSGIQTTSADIYSDMAGVYTENVDGLETVLTPESIMKYTAEQFDAIKKPGEFKNRTSAERGDAVCKVIDNHTWYIMMKADKDKLDTVRVGSKVSVGFESVTDSIVDAHIEYISPEPEGECVVVLSCDRYVDGILTMRSTDVRLIMKSYTGYKIPIYALRVQGTEKGVMIDNQGQEEFRECEVIYTDEEEGFVIIYPSETAEVQLQPMDDIIIGERY